MTEGSAVKGFFSNYGRHAIDKACNARYPRDDARFIRALHAMGADLDPRAIAGCIEHNKPHMLAALIALGADPYRSHLQEMTLVDLALSKEDPTCAKILIDHMGLLIGCDSPFSPFSWQGVMPPWVPPFMEYRAQIYEAARVLYGVLRWRRPGLGRWLARDIALHFLAWEKTLLLLM